MCEKIRCVWAGDTQIYVDYHDSEWSRPVHDDNKLIKLCSANGVTGYSWEECWRDYRLNAATMVLIPFYQYAGFKIKYDEWIGDLKGSHE